MGDKQVIMSYDLTGVRIASYTLWGPGFAPPDRLRQKDIEASILKELESQPVEEVVLHCDKLKGTIFSNPEFATDRPGN